MKAIKQTKKEAIKEAKKMYLLEYGKRPYKARVNIFERYPSGSYVLINLNGNTIEYYF